jgi:signal transduction histidine kinase
MTEPLLFRASLPTICSQVTVRVPLMAVMLTTVTGFPALFAVQVAVLMLFAWMFRKTAGRTPRPVNAIHAGLAAINAGDLGGRVPEPSGSGEIAGLAHTINNTLQRLDDAEERLQRSLDQQRQFASAASHELRTPLAGLRTELEEAQLHPDDTDLHHLLDRTLNNVDRLQAIITDLLLLAKIDEKAPPALEEIDLAELVRADIPRRVDDPHPVRIRLEPDLRIHAVRTQISRVLANLLDNAQQHAAHTVEIQLHRNGGSAELTTTDDGDGIAENDRARIFRPFTRLDTARGRDQGGTGLGLAIACAIAQSHNGTLHAEHPPLGGARLVLRLPLSPPHGSANC